MSMLKEEIEFILGRIDLHIPADQVATLAELAVIEYEHEPYTYTNEDLAKRLVGENCTFEQAVALLQAYEEYLALSCDLTTA